MSYKPSENDGLRKDGQPDQRQAGGHGFSGQDSGHVSELGKQGGSTQPEEVYKPSEHGGMKKDGTPDKRVDSSHGLGSRAKEEVQELGRQGGSS